jgi:hypothetical protein
MDDFSPAPIAPSLENSDEIEESLDIREDVKLSNAYFHPAWDKVVDLFLEKIEAYRFGCTDFALASDEYKVQDMTNKRVAVELNEILTRVQDAVETTESVKRRTSGGQ